MSIDPQQLQTQLNMLEDIEKATLRMITQAVYDFRLEAASIFAEERDLAADIGEDITREALDNMGVSKIPVRLLGKVDYKVARFMFHPNFSLRQALFVDSKAEKGASTATIQTTQTSMRIIQRRGNPPTLHNEQGSLPTILNKDALNYLTTTVFVKYGYETYRDAQGTIRNRLVTITVAALPNGMLQQRYNPDENDTIWRAGRNAPSLGEMFRVRLSFEALKTKANWRIQQIYMHPTESFTWDD